MRSIELESKIGTHEIRGSYFPVRLNVWETVLPSPFPFLTPSVIPLVIPRPLSTRSARGQLTCSGLLSVSVPPIRAAPRLSAL